MRVSDHNPSVPAFGHRPIEELEQALGLSFQDRGLLRQALTHRSWVNEHSGDTRDSYERLEFLGDVVVRLIVSEELYYRLPDCDEGGLTRRWTTLLSQRALAAVGERLGLGDYVMLGRGSDSADTRYGDSILGDVMESVIAAVYVDGGYEEASRFVLQALADEIDDTCRPNWRPYNPKLSCRNCCSPWARVHPPTMWSTRQALPTNRATPSRWLATGVCWRPGPVAAKTPPKPRPPKLPWQPLPRHNQKPSDLATSPYLSRVPTSSNQTNRLSLRGAPTHTCHCEERSDVAISLRLSTRRRIIIATAPRLPPPYQVRGRNDRLKVGAHEKNPANDITPRRPV